LTEDRSIRFGIRGTVQDVDYEGLAALWRRAEELDYDLVSVPDHFVAVSDDLTMPTFEGTAMLAALAATTSRIRCLMLVSGVTYRYPGVAAKLAATIDHISGGRLEYGVGAAWFGLEHEQYGIPFPSMGERIAMLDEACQIMRALWTEDRVTFEGTHYRLCEAVAMPKPVQARLPLVIGGGGERKMLRLVARHADVWNFFPADAAEYAHKQELLRGHCADIGRDDRQIRRSLCFRATLAATERGAASKRDAERRHLQSRLPVLVGTPEQCIDYLRPFAGLGVEDFLLGALPPYDYETIELIATRVVPAIRAVCGEAR
jgi:F420-dependent oxidoreductase-like protein